MDFGIRRIIKSKRLREFLIQQVQLSDTLYAVLVFDNDNNICYSACTEISNNCKTALKKSERKLLNKLYKEVLTKLYNNDFSFLSI